MLSIHITEDVMPSILTNVSALQASRQLGITSLGMKQTIERLTTGKRINHASDDASGLATANNYDADARIAVEQRKASFNSYYSEAAKDGYLEEATNQVMRAMELSVSNSSSSEMTTVSNQASVAANKAGVTLTAISSSSTASTALTSIATARATVASNMAQHLSNASLYGIESENKTAQKGNIMDADIGAEVVNLTMWQILSQSGTSALSNANQASQTVLALLR
jgi:flagellin